ncbi:MAG: DegT/DnrJ/EryC1/StrS family aminotransferase [Bacillaceae bacterium]
MQFRDLKTQYQKLKSEIDEAMIEVATNCNFISGNQVKELETQMLEYVGVKHCITCANGTDALSLAVMALGCTDNDVVFVPDFTFFSSGEIVSFAGAVPVFVDVKADTYNMDPVALEEQIIKVTETANLKPKAIVAVDLFGLPAEFREIRKIADKHGLKIIEDAAQGFGGNIDGKNACSFGDIATTSFFPAKPLGCYGDGGAVFTDEDSVADLLRSLRIHGKGQSKYDNVRIGMNSRLDTIQAAILKIKLKAFKDYELEDVNKVAKMYTEKLVDYVNESSLRAIPIVEEGYYSSWAQYTIQLSNKAIRNGLQRELKGAGIPSTIYYQKPMHKQDAFAKEKGCFPELYADENFKVTMKLCDTVLSLPMHPYMTEKDVDLVCGIIANCV